MIDDDKHIIEVADILSDSECAELIDMIEELSPKLAPIKTASGGEIRTDVRSNERVMFDDDLLAAKLFTAVADRLPQEIDGRVIAGANERFRCYRYKPGMRFAPHSDGSFVRNESELSYYSFLVYLNDEFSGGETTFYLNPNVVITPITGCGLLFLHPFVHEGSIVTEGVKYVARTDIMYRKEQRASGITKR